MAIRIIEFAAGYQTDELPGTAVSADTIGVTPITGLTATNVQAALAEHQSDIDSLYASGSSLAGTVSTHSGNISTLQSNVTNLQGRVTTAEGTLLTHSSQIADKADATATAAAIALKLAKSGDTATNLTIADKVTFTETTAPSSVPAGKLALFADGTDHTFYTKDSAGTVNKLGGGGLVPSRLTALPTTLANGVAYQLSQAGSTTALLPVTAVAATIEITDVKGTCSATNFIGITAGGSDTILYKGVPVTDRFVIRRRNATVRFNKAAGSSVWEVTYQTVSLPTGGLLPSALGSTIAYPNIGFTQQTYTLADTSGISYGATNTVQNITLQPGKYSVVGRANLNVAGASAGSVMEGMIELSTSLNLLVENESSLTFTQYNARNGRLMSGELIVNVPAGTTVQINLNALATQPVGTSGSATWSRRTITAKLIG